MFNKISEINELFNKPDKNEYVLKDKTHLVYVISSISKFDVLKNNILLKYSDLDNESVNKESIKLNDKIKDISLLKTIMCAELLKRNELKNDIEKYIEGKDVIESMKSMIKSKEDGLDYALSLSILDDYVDYLSGYNYNGPKTII